MRTVVVAPEVVKTEMATRLVKVFARECRPSRR
jgi:hypothetical protein